MAEHTEHTRRSYLRSAAEAAESATETATAEHGPAPVPLAR
jgi:hypothetical protein